MIVWRKYNNQSLKNGEYLLCILGDAGNNSGGLILQYVVAKYEKSKFYIYTNDEGYVNLEDVVWYDKIVAYINIQYIEFDNPWIVLNETIFVSNGRNLIVEYIREKGKYFVIDHVCNDIELIKEDLQNYCIIYPPLEEWWR
jgi:hypothetical protein